MKQIRLKCLLLRVGKAVEPARDESATSISHWKFSAPRFWSYHDLQLDDKSQSCLQNVWLGSQKARWLEKCNKKDIEASSKAKESYWPGKNPEAEATCSQETAKGDLW